MTKKEKEMTSEMRLKGISYSEIATALVISENTIKSFCRRKNLKKVNIEANLITTKDPNNYCKHCGKELNQNLKHKPKKFCSDACRNAYWSEHQDLIHRKAVYHINCECCGREFMSYGNKNRKYCSHDCYIKDRFEGGTVCDPRAI